MAIDLNQFRQDLTYQVTAPVSEILADLEAIVSFDQQTKAKKKRFSTILFVALVGVVLSIFVINSMPGAFASIGAIALVGCIIGVIYAGVMLRKHGRLQISPYRFQLLKQILEMVSRDLKDSDSIHANLVFSSPHQASKKTQTLPHPQRQGWKIDYFADLWLSLQGMFLDGTQFSLTSTEQAITQSGWKRGRSGKSKYKKKSKSKRIELELTLAYSKKKYQTTILQEDAEAAIKLPNFAQLKRFKIGNRQMYLKTKVPTNAANPVVEQLYQTITMMFLSLYQVLNLAHALQKPGSR